MKILGIDVGLAIVGYGLIEKNESSIKYLSHGVITTSKFSTNSERLVLIYNELNDLLDKEKPDLVGIEQLFFFRNATTIITVGQARGVILLALEEKHLKIVEVTPLQVKQFVSMYGKADKKQVQKMIKFLLNLNEIPKPDDAADGLAIALCSININKKNDITFKNKS